jgi:hypothetical protein
MNDADVGDLKIDVRKTIEQESVLRPFYKGDDSKP